MKNMTNEETIWNWLYIKFRNVYGVAALMGNLFAESSLNPILANNIKKHGLTNEEYTAIADSGVNDSFVNDGIAYGLAQWCYHTRKKELLDFAKDRRKSVGDLETQLYFLYYELQKYKTVFYAICDATNIKEASDIILLKYEKPKNKSDTVKAKRASFGQKYFNKYAAKTIAANELHNMVVIKDAPKSAVDELYNQLKEKMK